MYNTLVVLMLLLVTGCGAKDEFTYKEDPAITAKRNFCNKLKVDVPKQIDYNEAGVDKSTSVMILFTPDNQCLIGYLDHKDNIYLTDADYKDYPSTLKRIKNHTI